jgi:hypothetical protein
MRTFGAIGAGIALLSGVLLSGGAAQAQQTRYSWTGMGTNVLGSSKCPTYKMTIDITVEGNKVKGLFQQQGRDQRHFEATKDANGLFKTKAVVGGGNSLDVSGALKDGNSTVVLDGYCKFGGRLTKK